jgi:general secretion pathway protein M
MTAVLPYLKGRPAALAILSIAALLLLAVIAAPLLALFAGQSDDLQNSVNQLAVYRAEIAARPLVEARLKDALTRASTAPGLLHAANAALAAAEVESAFKSIVSANGGEIRSSQILPATKANGYEIVAIEYDLNVPMSHLRDLTYAVETHDPYLFIDDATIGAGQSAPSSAAPQDLTLELRWTLRAYRWAGRL